MMILQIYNSYYKKFIRGDVGILDEKVLFVDYKNNIKSTPTEEIDCGGGYLIPGFIDIHMHIESSMTTPEIFTNKIKKYGVTTIVAEPHEIANVYGKDGIEEFIKSEGNCPIDIFYGIPSSVPSTNEKLETTGAVLNFEEMKEISTMDKVICVGEVMNYTGVIKDNNLEISKFLKYVRETRKDLIIEGHCPRLLGEDLSRFLYLGINGDRTEHNLEEIKERFENGMFIEIQEKMLRNEILEHIITNNLYENMCFVTDDIMPDYLIDNGHLNNIVKCAVEKGFKLEDAIYCATMTPAKRMRLFDRGVIAPGKIADILLIDDAKKLTIRKTLKNGKVIYDKEGYPNKKEMNLSYKFPKEMYNSMKLSEITRSQLEINISHRDSVRCRVIEVNNRGTATKEVFREIKVKNGKLDITNSDCVFVAVFERYNKGSLNSIGLATGDIIKKGAVATTYAHDSHNLLIVGKTLDEMILAGNKVIENQGGMVSVEKGEILSNIKLNVAGILSEEPIDILGKKIRRFKETINHLGYNHYNPIMSLCTLTLPVSPELKITDKGLIDVKNNKIVNLIV